MSYPVQTNHDDLANQLRESLRSSAAEREHQQSLARNRLRDQVQHLREPSDHNPGPGSLSSPAFKLTASPHYPGVAEPGGDRSGSGQLSPAAEAKFLEHLKSASEETNPHRRDAAVAKAAKTAGQDWDQKNGIGKGEAGLINGLRQGARAQMMFAAREIGEKLGVSPAVSSAVGYSLERALEKEGFRVLASHAVDKASDLFRPSTASVASATGVRHALESNLSKSVNWLASHGVTRDAIKDVVKNHSGKFIVISELASNPEALSRAAHLISKSDRAIDGIMAVATDKELRQAVGSVTMATGEAVASVGARSVGSIAVVAGAVMRGDSASDTGRHIFRAALAILGGAAGGVAGGAVSAGFGSVAGAIGGAELGSRLADKILSVYDRVTGTDASQEQSAERLVSSAELKQSTDVISQRAGSAAGAAANDTIERFKSGGGEGARDSGEKESSRERVMEMSQSMG